jgi:hypothetical protein
LVTVGDKKGLLGSSDNKEFRGICKLDIDPQEGTIAISCPSGSGKKRHHRRHRAADDAILYSQEEVPVFNSEPTVPFFCEVFKMKDACVLLRIVIERAFRQRFFGAAIVIVNHARCLRRPQPAEQNAFAPPPRVQGDKNKNAEKSGRKRRFMSRRS